MMAKGNFILVYIIARLTSILRIIKPWTNKITLPPHKLPSTDIVSRLHLDNESKKLVSKDFGNLVSIRPYGVLFPSCIDDIVALVKLSYNSSTPFTIAARGKGHSIRGQAMARNGVVVDMTSLNKKGNNGSMRVCWNPNSKDSCYVDVGGEQLWIDVLEKTLDQGVAPVSWTDYLYLTVGGTLSNAGISGQSFRYGPQISNVYEMDVITGKGDLLTCSRKTNSELFYGVLGGLGQFGIITRARIALEAAPRRVKWVRMLYDDFSTFTEDQERLISIDGLDYVEGSLILHQNSPNNWRSSFFSSDDHSKITSLVTKHGIVYCLEVVKYYTQDDDHIVNNELVLLLKGLSYNPGLIFTRDVTFVDFLNRVRSGELKLKSEGLWDVPHPWLNLYVPKSSISDFDSGVFKGIVLEQKEKITGPILIYPTNRNKWDGRMSAVIPDEDIFYCVGFLHSSDVNDWRVLEAQNNQILKFLNDSGIKYKQYLASYQTKEDWMNHFGSKWKTFQREKLGLIQKLFSRLDKEFLTPFRGRKGERNQFFR